MICFNTNENLAILDESSWKRFFFVLACNKQQDKV